MSRQIRLQDVLKHAHQRDCRDKNLVATQIGLENRNTNMKVDSFFRSIAEIQ